MDLGLQGKVAVVLAASKGLGRASAAALAKEGARVVIGSRNQQVLEETAQQIQRESGSQVLAVPTDVTKPQDLETIIATAASVFGRIDILVNNAGGPPPGNFSTFAEDSSWQAAFELNLLSAIRLIRLALPHMRKQGSGRIINIVSVSVKQPLDGLILSNAIRPGVIGLAKSLSVELGPEHITINNVCPGRILTDRLRQFSALEEKLRQGMSEEEVFKNEIKDIPLGRIGRPEDVGALVAFLASQAASYITGTTISVDGGLVRSIL
jgi:3-oxoacyl-[acyl-carrier protein] reductase